jgi:hypothetical protein
LTVSQRELEQISECAAIESEAPNNWVRRVAADVARTYTRLVADE